MPKLFSYQEPHAQKLIDALMFDQVALDASDLGTGKTVVACHIAKTLEKEAIVVGKKVMIPTWRYWMESFGVNGVVGNWELARRRGLPDREGALYIFDEVHEAAGYKTLNSKLLINTFEMGHMVLMLSATAIESPLKMYALGYILGFHNLRDYYRWMFRNGVVKNFGYGGHHFNGSKKVLAYIHEKIFPERGSRMRKEEIPDFPECQYIVELVEGLSDPRLETWERQIDCREAQHALKMAESDRPWDPTGDILPEILYERMRAELGKVPALLEMIKEGRAEGYRLVVFVNFLTTLAALENILDLDETQLLFGDQRNEDRLRAIAQFQAGNTPILTCTIDSGGASIDLHDTIGAQPRLALVCPTWRAVTFRQALGRVHRAGAKSKSIQKLVFCAGTIEERVAARVRQKLNAIDTINDSDLTLDEAFLETKTAGD
jgi:superfamily II DNA or RNA helicase